MLFMICTATSNIIEGAYLGGNSTSTLWSAMSSFQAIDFSNPATAVGGMVIGVWQMMGALFKMLIWDYAFLEGDWEIVKYVIFWPISFGLIFSIIMVIRGVSGG